MKLSFLWVVAFLSPGSTANKASKDDVAEVENKFGEDFPDMNEDFHRRLDITYLNDCDLATGVDQCCSTYNEWKSMCEYVGEDFEVDTGSCQYARGGATGSCDRAASENGSAKIGKGSCIGEESCMYLGSNGGVATVMDNSCNNGDPVVIRNHQCYGAGADDGYAYIGSNSCRSSSDWPACYDAGESGNATILDNSCNGNWGCRDAGERGNFFVDEGSCGTVGTDASILSDCRGAGSEGYEMSSATIGKNSCHGQSACEFVGRGLGHVTLGVTFATFGGHVIIGDNCCLGFGSCLEIGREGGNVVIHDGSCHCGINCHAEGRACWNVGHWASADSSATIMGGSCIGERACMDLGAGASRYDRALGSVEVGVNACKGRRACQGAGKGVAIIGDDSCVTNDAESNQYDVCRDVGGIGSHFEVGRGSCKNGRSSCQLLSSPRNHIVIGDSSCFGHYSCSFINNPENVTIGSNSCQCEDCCGCLGEGAVVPDNKCNSFGTGADSCCDGFSLTMNPNFVPTGLVTSPTPPTRSLTTDPPTTVFQGQNFTIGKPQSSFVDTNGNFSIMFDYSLGQSIDNLSVTLSYQNCSTPYDETDPVVWLSTQVALAEPVVFIDTKQFANSNLILEKSLNESIGVLAFCMRVDGHSTDGTSISFRQDAINLSFDLSSNTFEVTDNGIEADAVLTSENNVTTSYSVSAYRCSQDGFEDIGTDTQLTQNEVVQICLQPVNDGVFISAFSMGFYQDTAQVKYEAVRIDGWVNPLSQLSSNDKIKKVASRVVSKFFDGDANPFSVEGNAYLSFDTSRTRLLRSIQESNEAGETPFKMDVQLEKGTVPPNTKESNIKGHAAMSVIGGLLILSIAFVVLKKFK